MKILSMQNAIYDFFLPSERNERIPRALGFRAFFYYAYFIALVMVALYSPIMKSLPYRAFLGALSEQLILAETNPQRENIAVAPLAVDPLLSEAARMKAEDMIARDYFSHLGPSGELPWVWINNVGYSYAAAGENLAIDFSDPTALVRAWMASPTHAANIQNGTFTDVGIGVASGTFNDRETNIVVMFLGKKAQTVTAAVVSVSPTPTPTPVPAPAPAPAPIPAPSPTSSPVETEVVPTETEVSEPVNAVASAEGLSEKIEVLGAAQENVYLEKPLEVYTATEPTEEIAASKDASGAEAQAKSFFFVQAPTLARAAVSVFFLAIFAVATIIFLLGHSSGVVMVSRASALLILAAIMWLPKIF